VTNSLPTTILHVAATATNVLVRTTNHELHTGPHGSISTQPFNWFIVVLNWFASVLNWLVVEHPEAFLLLLFAWLGSEIASLFSLRWWSFYRRFVISCFSRYHCWRKSHHLRIVTIDDYVRLLEKLRSAIIGRYKYRTEIPTILIHVFTQQLPRACLKSKIFD
jgi:hypothetical protein